MVQQPRKPKQIKKSPEQIKSKLNFVAQYSGLAFEMLFLMLGGVFLGIKLDNLFGTKPLLTAILSVLGVVLAIYFALRKEFKKPESK